MFFGILLTAQVIICAAMGGLILIQRSEGGALGMGGGPSGFMSARGAGNLLTKLTWVFAALLFANSVAMTVVGNVETHGTSAVDQIDTSKLTQTPVAPSAATAPAAASSTSSAPSLNDLPIAGAPQAAPQTTAPQAALPQASGAQAGNALLNAPASHAAPAKMPAPLSATGLGTSKTSHSAAPNIFQSSSSPNVKAPASSSSSPSLLPSSSSSTPAPATPSSSQ